VGEHLWIHYGRVTVFDVFYLLDFIRNKTKTNFGTQMNADSRKKNLRLSAWISVQILFRIMSI